MTDTGTRTGIVYLADDGSDPVTAYRTSIRNTVAALEDKGALYVQQSATPTPGVEGRFFKDSDDLGSGVIYYDNGSALEAIGSAAPTDGSAATPSLRTLGSGATQASAGNHTHAIGAITGTGDTVTKNVGTASGTVAAGDHTHTAAATGFQSVTKASSTARASNATITNDPHLQLSLTAGTYRVTALISVTGSTTGDFATIWSFTGTATVTLRGVTGPAASSTSGPSGSDTLSWSPVITDIGAGAGQAATYGTASTTDAMFVREEMILVVTATGTLAFMWAQAVSNATATTVAAGSTLTAQKLA